MEQQEETSTSHKLSIFFGGFFALLALYVISMGPAALIFTITNSSNYKNNFEIVYAPLLWLMDNSELCELILDIYLGLWMD